jgi:hypothetical protein
VGGEELVKKRLGYSGEEDRKEGDITVEHEDFELSGLRGRRRCGRG